MWWGARRRERAGRSQPGDLASWLQVAQFELPAVRVREQATGGRAPRGVLDLALRGGYAAPAQAREVLRPLLEDRGESTVRDSLLLVSEAVSNAVVRGRSDESAEIKMHVVLGANAVRVEVAGAGGRFARLAAVPDDTDTGLGLRIVDAIADRWHGDGSRIWFELLGAGDRVSGVARPRSREPRISA